jgi:hypothetical protein
MTDAERGEMLTALIELARRYPHWRLGQLVTNVAGWADVDLWDAEDAQLLAAARAHPHRADQREATGPAPDQGLKQPVVA